MAVISSVHRFLNLDDSELRRLIKCTGHLNEKEIENFIPVYKRTMNDMIELFSSDSDLKKYIGIE